MKTLFLVAVFFLLAGCSVNVPDDFLSRAVQARIDSYMQPGNYRQPDYSYTYGPTNSPWLVDPLPQPGSSMNFSCRDALNRGDSGAAFIFC